MRRGLGFALVGALSAQTPTEWARIEVRLPPNRSVGVPTPSPREAHWGYLDAMGRLVAHGKGRPDGEAVGPTRQGVFFPWQTLEDLLVKVPDHGEARRILLEDAIAVVRMEGRGLPRGRGPAGRVGVPVAALIKALRKVPDWPRQVDLAASERPLLPGLALVGGSGELEGMASDVLTVLQEDPAEPLAIKNMALLLPHIPMDRRLGFAQKVVWEVEPLPWASWPPEPILEAVYQSLASLEAWSEIGTLMAPLDMPREPGIEAAEWDTWERCRALRCLYQGAALTWERGWSQLLPGLDRLRGVAGQDYAALGRRMVKHSKPAPDRDSARLVQEALALPPLKGRPCPRTEPWRLCFADPEVLKGARVKVDRHPELVLWGPRELQLTAMPAEWRKPGRDWALIRAGRVALEGRDLPSGAMLVARMRLQGLPRLEVVGAHLARRPNSVALRALRIGLVAPRMPVAALESELATDCHQARVVPEVSSEVLDSNLWHAESDGALRDLSAHLARWPGDAKGWKAYAFWTTFRPSLQGPVDFAQTLPPWEGDVPILLQLPIRVHQEVAGELARRGAHREALAWFRPAWDSLASRKGLARFLPKGLGQELLGSLRGSLHALGRYGEARSLEDAGAWLPPARGRD